MRSPCGAGPENTISHGEHVLYGWGKDAPAMHLPDGAGFSVGPRTGIRTAILQVPTLPLQGLSSAQDGAVGFAPHAWGECHCCPRGGPPRRFWRLLPHDQIVRQPFSRPPSFCRRCTTRSCGLRATTRACAWS